MGTRQCRRREEVRALIDHRQGRESQIVNGGFAIQAVDELAGVYDYECPISPQEMLLSTLPEGCERCGSLERAKRPAKPPQAVSGFPQWPSLRLAL
jgi:hypothetical protein